ncbi:Activator of stress genes-like protein [Emericellopsis cladophorae]|uniref:Activator of stress genes-like protein n=1 Tax=Emericellopsis cladophorae TaxID=2686198 RepID=A0A9P9XX34_9HYPO|nr:Activator of stress genes-like protein [Emericellopsis cladophorae]KAI6779163.1 Activator of stress genes-like protein [Emericellopsis cladophorae]
MAGLSQDMSEDDGGLTSHDWTTHGGVASPGASDSEHEPADPGAPSQPIQKRRRVTRACDECRRKKIKCDGKQPCTHCSVYSYECTYDKPSNRRRNPAPQYIEALEGRLQRAETLLRKFMPDVDLADPNLDPAVQQEFHNREQARARAARQHGGPSNVPPPSSSDSNDAQIVSMIDSTGQLDIDDKGGWDFHGISSGSMFLKRMKEHFRGKLGPSAKLPFTTKPERPAAGLANLDPPTPVGQSPFSSVSNYAELPSKEVTRNLCYYSLGCATCLVRIVHVPSFYEKLDKIYDRPVESLNQEETHFLGLVYAVLALGCMYESLDEQNSHKMSVKEAMDEGMKYYKSARALIQDVTQCRDLTSLQALLFIILFLQATSNMSACYTFVGIALRSALHMGLHRHLKHDQIDTIEDETRRRVFYVIRQMDIYLSTLLGFPLMLNTDDVDQPFPTEVDDEFVTYNMILQPPPGSSSFFVAFNAHTRLMEILAKITKYVYPIKGSGSNIKRQKSAAASTYSISYSRIKEIEGELQQWFERLPETWRPSPEGPIEVVRVRHLLRFVYAHVQLVLYRPFLHYVSPRLSQGTKIDELSYACAAAAISVSRNIVHIGLEIRKQRVLSGPYWFMLYTEFFAVLSLVFYAIENPEKPGSAEVLADAQAGRKMIAELADKSLAAERVTKSLQVLFEQLPEKLDPANHKPVQSKKRSAQNSGKAGPIPMFSTGRQSSISSQRTGDLARARNGGRSAPAYSTPASRGSGDAVPSMSEQCFQDPSFTGMPDLLAFDMSSRATSGSPSTASSSQQPYAIQQQGQPFNGRNPVNKLDNLMFPSEDPFAYPNQPMMELGYQPPAPMGQQQQAQGSQFFMPGSMNDMDSQLLGQPPPYAIQHPEGQPGLEFSANMFDPNMYNVPMSGQQSHSQPPSTSSQSIHSTISQGRRVHPRRQERQIDQMFDQNGMQADWGGFFGSGRGVFQGM